MQLIDSTIDLEGYSIHLLRSNEPVGKSILFLHGMKFTADTWDSLGTLERVQEEGYNFCAIELPGFGQSPPADIEPVHVLKQVIINQKLDKPILIGPSMGGKVSLDFVIAQPELVGGLVLIGAVGVDTITDKLAEIKVPTLIVWGSEDAISPVKNGHTLDSLIPDSNLVMVQGAPHPCYLDQPDIWHWELISFLKGNF